MGAYGHSRLAEFIFGGATRFVLSRLDRPGSHVALRRWHADEDPT